MGVAHEDEIDTRHLLRNCDRSILIRDLSGVDFTGAQILLKSHVHCNHYHVSALFSTQNRNPLPRFA